MLTATDLRKHYGPVVALDGCSFVVERGRQLGLLGQNGSGKTTAMRAIFGLVELDGGSVTWEDDPIGPSQRSGFGYMPEERGLYPTMGVHEQLVHLAELHGMERPAAVDATTRWLDEVGLGDRAGDHLESLSHGNQQRVQLIAALVHQPELLVLDEPFAGLDPLGLEAMEEMLRREVERGAAVVFSSHQLDLVESLCDDVVVIDDGRDVLSGQLDEIREGSRQRRVEVAFGDGFERRHIGGIRDVEIIREADGALRLAVPADMAAEEVLGALRDAGEVTRFSFEPPHLSDLYREAVRG